MKFKMSNPLSDGAFGRIVVQTVAGQFVFPCILVVEDGYDDFNFCVHKATDFIDEWSVSEISTGYRVAQGKSIKEVMEIATKVLSKQTPEKVRSAIKKALAS